MSAFSQTLARPTLSSFRSAALHDSLRRRCRLPASPLILAPLPRAASHAFNLFSSSAAATTLDCPTDLSDDTVDEILTDPARVSSLMKMDRRPDPAAAGGRWFPYLNRFSSGEVKADSRVVIEALEPYINDSRKERLRRAVENRSYSVCLVVEGLSDYGNVSAAFRSADALGIQSVHVISRDGRKRYRDNRHVSRGAEKWLDIELWSSPLECFTALRKRGYRIATTHLGLETVSVYDLDWSQPTAIVVGNESMGITDEALQLSDLQCSIPMKGMVDSFNVSVAAGILMHHVVCDRVSRLGCHGDLTSEESQVLLAEFYLRHKEGTIRIVHEYAKRKVDGLVSRL